MKHLQSTLMILLLIFAAPLFTACDEDADVDPVDTQTNDDDDSGDNSGNNESTSTGEVASLTLSPNSLNFSNTVGEETIVIVTTNQDASTIALSWEDGSYFTTSTALNYVLVKSSTLNLTGGAVTDKLYITVGEGSNTKTETVAITLSSNLTFSASETKLDFSAVAAGATVTVTSNALEHVSARISDGDDYFDCSEISEEGVITVTPKGDASLVYIKYGTLTISLSGQEDIEIPLSQFFRVGDVYDSVGYVYETADDGKTLKMMSLKDGGRKLWFGAKDVATLCGADSDDDGEANCLAMETAADYDSLTDWTSTTDYQALKWCRALGSGWYLPARSELSYLITNYGSKSDFNDLVVAAGGTRFVLDEGTYPNDSSGDGEFYWSSTESEALKAYAVNSYTGANSSDFSKYNTTEGSDGYTGRFIRAMKTVAALE